MSSLTGESVPVNMVVEPADRDSVIEARNVAFSSALVVDGTGLGVVTRYVSLIPTLSPETAGGMCACACTCVCRSIADNTYIGTIAGLASGEVNRKTTMYIEVQRFVYAITIMAVVMGVILSIIGFSEGQPWQSVLLNAFVSIIIGNVPEGLPATVTSMLSLACTSLAEKNVYVKKTDIIESLGSASVICSDKTGTLTMNLMTCVRCLCPGGGCSGASLLRPPRCAKPTV